MPISLERFVDIESAVIGAPQAQARQLVGLRFSTNPLVPADAFVTARDALSVGDYFGMDSAEYSFALDYFNYRSKQPARRPPMLRFAAHVGADRAPRVFGAPGTYNVQQFNSITDGSFGITMGENVVQVNDLDLSAIVSLADVATAVQAAIRAVADGGPVFADAVVAFDSDRSAFILVGGAAGASPMAITAGETGTDISYLLGWDNALTVTSPGAAARTPAESLAAANNFNDSFGSFSFDYDMPVADQLAVAQLNATLNVKFMFLAWTNPQDLNALANALVSIPGSAVHVNGVSTTAKHSESLPAAILASIDFGARNSLPNFMFQQNPAWFGVGYGDVNDDMTADQYDAMRVNYYGNTATAGQDIQFYQRGYMTGGPTSPQDMTVYAGEQWLKAQVKADLINMLLNLNSLPANNDGRALVMVNLTGGAIETALLNGTILIDKALTQNQQAAITEMTGDGNAWQQVQTSGFWLDARVEAFTGPSNLTEYRVVYTLIYAKRDVVRKIEGSHNLV